MRMTIRRIGLRGAEATEFLLSANPGEELRPLAKVISGGELSRVMLAVKTILAAADDVPTLVFDEVDAGIGGRVAEYIVDISCSVNARKTFMLGIQYSHICRR